MSAAPSGRPSEAAGKGVGAGSRQHRQDLLDAEVSPGPGVHRQPQQGLLGREDEEEGHDRDELDRLLGPGGGEGGDMSWFSCEAAALVSAYEVRI